MLSCCCYNPADVCQCISLTSLTHTVFAIRLVAQPFGSYHFRGFNCIHSRCGLITCKSAKQILVCGLHTFHCFQACHIATEFQTFILMGLTPIGFVHLAGRTTVRESLSSYGSSYSNHFFFTCIGYISCLPMIKQTGFFLSYIG